MIDLDHIAYYVPKMDAASQQLRSLGFTLTPFSEQSHRPDPNGPLVAAGTGNQCVMLREGYLEFLTPLSDTANARQLHAAMARYTGVHLIAFGTADAHADHARLAGAGFAPLAPLALQRTVETPDGTATARFTVVRVPPETMAEGRIQYCQHHTREVVWQPRWITHANAARGLAGVILCVAEPADTARRYARFTGLAALPAGAAWRIDTERGYVLFTDAAALHAALGLRTPALPWIAGHIVDSSDMAATRAQVGGTALGDRVLVSLSEALGGFMLFQAAGSAPFTLNKKSL